MVSERSWRETLIYSFSVGDEVAMIERAKEIARKAHATQFRKYHDVRDDAPVPYFVHPCRVADRVADLPGSTAVMVAAAFLHDTIEDCEDFDPGVIERECGERVLALVLELTNPSHSIPPRSLKRPERKRIDREHLEKVSTEAKRIKLVDRIDNLGDMKGAEDQFKELYVCETLLLLEYALKGADEALERECFDAAIALRETIGQ
jgi:(p)ppGpp synthase/HD superfamily hydrolase